MYNGVFAMKNGVIALLFSVSLLAAASGYAADTGPASAVKKPATVAAPDKDAQKKRDLVLKFYEVNPPRDLIDASIAAIAASRYGPNDPDREEFISRMQLAVDYDKMEKISTEEMVKIFTLPELQAMVDYYTSDLGMAAQAKLGTYRQNVAPELKKMLDAAILDYVATPSPAEAAAQTP